MVGPIDLGRRARKGMTGIFKYAKKPNRKRNTIGARLKFPDSNYVGLAKSFIPLHINTADRLVIKLSNYINKSASRTIFLTITTCHEYNHKTDKSEEISFVSSFGSTNTNQERAKFTLKTEDDDGSC